MRWTFGIITDGRHENRVAEVIDSIHSQNHCDSYQIMVVSDDEKRGMYCIDTYGSRPKRNDHQCILIERPIKDQWITFKKNIIVDYALHDNLCFLHDYVSLEDGWCAGFEVFGSDWLTCMTTVRNKNNERFRDWCVIYNDAWMEPPIDDQTPPGADAGRMMKYNTRGHERWQYYSGAYFCAKKSVMSKVPLDESRVWGQGEDVQFSRRIYKKFGPEVFQMNPHSSVKFLKQKDNAPWQGLSEL